MEKKVNRNEKVKTVWLIAAGQIEIPLRTGHSGIYTNKIKEKGFKGMTNCIPLSPINLTTVRNDWPF